MTYSNVIPLFIVNYNGLRKSGSTFLSVVERAVEASTCLGYLRVILVDNGSRDGSLDVVMDRFGM